MFLAKSSRRACLITLYYFILFMKKITFLISGLLFAPWSFAQNDNGETKYEKCVNFGVSKPIIELSKEAQQEKTKKEKSKETHNKRLYRPKINPNALPLSEDPIRQSVNGERVSPAPLANWAGQSGSGYPPDPSGAAGPNHYFQAVNLSYRIYNKSGTALISELDLSSLWPGSADDGDPIVLYDKHADRWFISQFQTTGNKILIAISKTSDPTGAYYTYTFVPSSSDFPDYPKFSIWADGYYMTSNFNNQKVVVFEREKMLAGLSASMIVKSLPSTPSGGFFCPLAADADGQLPPYGTPCYMFSYEDDGWGGSATTDQIRIYKMTTNWTTPSATTLVLDQKLPTQAFDAVFSSSWDDISQKGTSSKLDAIAGVFNYRAQYRIWTGYNTITLCNAVKVNSTTGIAGIRWYELRQDNTTKVWSIYQQGTFSPDNENRWLGSIAMDDAGNIGMAYAVSGANTFPSLRYTGRFANDPLGQMTFSEQTAVTGTSAQIGVNRFGDYSHTSLDPDGITFWHTGEYVTASSPKTRIFSFRLMHPEGIQETKDLSEFKVFQSGNQLNFSAVNLASNEPVVVDLFDVSGRLISSKNQVPVANGFQTSIDVSNLIKGTYLIRVGNQNFQKVVKVVVN